MANDGIQQGRIECRRLHWKRTHEPNIRFDHRRLASRLNQWDGRHWSVRARLKRSDREIVALYARLAAVPPATGRRRVSLRLTLGPRQRGADPDAYWKSLLDALVHSGLLIDDNRQDAELGEVTFERGPVRRTEIILQDDAET